MLDYRIAPSILSADFGRLAEEVSSVIEAGADLIHIDVMDNHYVPNLTFGPIICEAVKKVATVPVDVHLMVSPVDELVKDFASVGADIISFHPEATGQVTKTIQMIGEQGCQVGMVINPSTSLSYLPPVIDSLDLVLLMSVNPGFGGQKFLDGTFHKIKSARSMIDESGRSIALQVDGGINVGNIGLVAEAGADTFVAGSAIFGTDDYVLAFERLRSSLPPK